MYRIPLGRPDYNFLLEGNEVEVRTPAESAEEVLKATSVIHVQCRWLSLFRQVRVSLDRLSYFIGSVQASYRNSYMFRYPDGTLPCAKAERRFVI